MSKCIKLLITPNTNIDYEKMSVIDETNGMVKTVQFNHDDAVPMEFINIPNTAFVYRAYDLQCNEHFLIHEGVRHRILHKTTFG